LGPNPGFPREVYDALRKSQVFADVLIEAPPSRVEVDDRPGAPDSEPASASFVSGSYFPLLGVDPLFGRMLTPADETDREAPLVISYRFWMRRFGLDPAVLGRPVLLNGISFVIVGVAPAGFDGTVVGTPADIWAPLPLRKAVLPNGQNPLTVMARLKPG